VALHGDVLAAQCHLSRDRDRVGPRQQWKQQRRNLFRKHALEWLGDAKLLLADHEFVRGFLHRATLQTTRVGLDDFDHCCRELFVREPLLQYLRFAPPTFGQTLDPRVYLNVLRSPELPRLFSLSMDGCQLTPDHARDLAGIERLRGLRRLLLAQNALGDEGVAAVAASPHLEGLTAVVLNECQVGREGLRAIAGAATLRHVQHLGLSSCEPGRVGLRRLGRSQHLEALTSLDLRMAQIDGGMIGSLLAGPLVGGLHRLNLGSNPLGDEGACGLAASPLLSNLRELTLSNTEIRPGGIVALARSPHLANLTHLYLSGNYFDERATRELAGSRHLGRLERLDVRSAFETGAAAALVRELRLPALRELRLFIEYGSVAELATVAAAPALARLEVLHLEICELPDSLGTLLLRSPHLAGLRELHLGPVQMSRELREGFEGVFGRRLKA
jgi:hypothetical protein